MQRGAPPGPTSRAGEDALHATSGRSLPIQEPSKKDTSTPHSTEATAINSEYETMACCSREWLYTYSSCLEGTVVNCNKVEMCQYFYCLEKKNMFVRNVGKFIWYRRTLRLRRQYFLPWLIRNLMGKILVYLRIIHSLKPSTCFEHYPAHLQEVNVVIVYMQPLVSSLSAGDCPVHLLRKNLTGAQDSRGTRWRSWLRRCATSRKVAGSIRDGVTGIFHWHNPFGQH